jgi:hypothetical protein
MIFGFKNLRKEKFDHLNGVENYQGFLRDKNYWNVLQKSLKSFKV